MNIEFSQRGLREYGKLPKRIRKKADRQLAYLSEDWKHPSLNTKKYDKKIDLYQARIDKKYRFYFFIKYPNYVVVSLIKHPK